MCGIVLGGILDKRLSRLTNQFISVVHFDSESWVRI